MNPDQEINLGAAICEKLKAAYFPDVPWVTCRCMVAERLRELKKKMKGFMPDKTDIELLQELLRYSNEDILDVMEI